MANNRIQLMDIPIDSVSRSEALRRALTFLHTDRFHQIATIGPEFLLEASANPRFAEILKHVDLALPEGMGIAFGARLTGQRISERYPGVDFVHDLLAAAAQHGRSVFLYGAAHAVVERAVLNLLRQYPGLNIVGFESGYRGVSWKLHERRIVERIRLAKPDILLVALGAPKQELWIDRHRQALHHVKIAIGVGRTFEYLAGTIPRAPATIRKLGLEWAHTFLYAGRYHDPKHRRQRVVNATWHFLRTVRKRRHA